MLIGESFVSKASVAEHAALTWERPRRASRAASAPWL